MSKGNLLRVLRLRQARDSVGKAQDWLQGAHHALGGIDPCFDELRLELQRMVEQLGARHRELITYASLAASMQTTQQRIQEAT